MCWSGAGEFGGRAQLPHPMAPVIKNTSSHNRPSCCHPILGSCVLSPTLDDPTNVARISEPRSSESRAVCCAMVVVIAVIKNDEYFRQVALLFVLQREQKQDCSAAQASATNVDVSEL